MTVSVVQDRPGQDPPPAAAGCARLYRAVQTGYREAQSRADTEAEQSKWRDRGAALRGFMDALSPTDTVGIRNAADLLRAELAATADVLATQIGVRLH